MKFYWFNKHCCVPECFNSSTEGEGCFKEYFDLPAEPQARRRWLNAILTEDGENLKICEDHFMEDDVFRDKNNRKKLRLNSIPTMKLPKNICSSCLGSKILSCNSVDFEARSCQCGLSSIALQPLKQISPSSKRTRITWTAEEKRTLFKAIRKYGDVRVGNNNIRINWPNVVTHCRSNGCFGNEKELKSVWQNIRINATKVYRNNIFGSKLDRKVSRFLYGNPQKKARGRALAGGSSSNELNHKTGSSTDEDDEYHDRPRPMIQDLFEEEENNCLKLEENLGDTGVNTTKIEEIKEEGDDEAAEDQESDEYYSISDVETLFQIKIRPKSPSEIISLLSSDDEE